MIHGIDVWLARAGRIFRTILDRLAGPVGIPHEIGEWLVRKAGPQGARAAGFANMRKGNYKTAAAAFADAERLLVEKEGTPADIAQMIEFQAWCLGKLGQKSQALKLYEQAMRFEEQAQSPPERISKLRAQIDWARDSSQ